MPEKTSGMKVKSIWMGCAALLMCRVAAAAEVGPVAPWGSSDVFQRSVLAVETLMSKGDFGGAKKLLARLPRTKLTVGIAKAKVPASRLPDVESALKSAITEWMDRVPGMKIVVAEKPDVLFTFEPEIAPPDRAAPLGAAFFESDDAKDPRVEAVLALARTSQKTPATSRDLRNEMVYAIGRFMGLEATPRLSGAMDRTDEPSRMDARVVPNNTRLMYQNLATVAELTKLIDKKVKVEPAKPVLFVDTLELNRMDGVVQGDVVAFSIGITNRGNAPLHAMLIPDCSCFAIQADPVVQPGETKRVGIQMDTREFPGMQTKHLVLFSNDLDQTSKMIVTKVNVQPRYRIVPVTEESVTIADDKGWKKEFYFWSAAANPLKPVRVTVDGVKAVVDFAEWSGEAADPGMGEMSMPRKGYKITVLGTPNVEPGRSYGNVFIETEDPNWPRVATSFTLQKGIAVFPFVANFGRIKAQPSIARVVLSRPGKPFKVVSVECSIKALSATVEQPNANGDIPITIRFDGKAPSGDLDASMVVKTDDPSQPTITVPITAVIE